MRAGCHVAVGEVMASSASCLVVTMGASLRCEGACCEAKDPVVESESESLVDDAVSCPASSSFILRAFADRSSTSIVTPSNLVDTPPRFQFNPSNHPANPPKLKTMVPKTLEAGVAYETSPLKSVLGAMLGKSRKKAFATKSAEPKEKRLATSQLASRMGNLVHMRPMRPKMLAGTGSFDRTGKKMLVEIVVAKDMIDFRFSRFRYSSSTVKFGHCVNR